MPRIRTLALVTAVAVAGIVLSSPIQACDDRATPGCQQPAAASGAAPAAFDQHPIKVQTGRRRLQQRRDDPSPNVTMSVTTKSDRDTGISLPQFPRFISKQSIATATAEDLRSPWPESVSFAVTSTYPVGGGLLPASESELAFLSQTPTSELATNLKQPTANEVVVDDHNDFADDSRRATGEKRTVAAQTRASDNGPGSITWIELVFLAWGGLLTVGSGLRLIFG